MAKRRKRLWIEGLQLKSSDIGRLVKYVPGLKHKCKGTRNENHISGSISHWNSTYVFVEYELGSPLATCPEDLIWR